VLGREDGGFYKGGLEVLVGYKALGKKWGAGGRITNTPAGRTRLTFFKGGGIDHKQRIGSMGNQLWVIADGE